MTRGLHPSPRRVLDTIRELAGEGYEGMVERVGRSDPFRVLVSTMLSLRTKDELTEQRSRVLFARARTPQGMIRLGEDRIARIIYPVGFYRRKAGQIVATSRILLEEHAGRVPDTVEELVTLPGVGRKTANLVVNLGYGKSGICVDTHVHRITNRWGWVRTTHPDRTERELRVVLPERHWIEVNLLLVFFGKRVCTPVAPRCSTCPLAGDCPRIGVQRHR
jgi:endonuclease-3